MTLEKLAKAVVDLVAQLARHLLEMFLVVVAIAVMAAILVYAGYSLGAPTHVQYVLGGVPMVLGASYIIWRTVTFNMNSTNQFFADVENMDK